MNSNESCGPAKPVNPALFHPGSDMLGVGRCTENGTAAARRGNGSAFDAIAAEYDAVTGANPILQWMRQQVWEVAENYFRPGQKILELGCGTGIDAVHFARQGIEWWATDRSADMLDVVRKKKAGSRYGDRIQVRRIDITRLDELVDSAGLPRFDGVFSNFGALNCGVDLRRISGDLWRLLKPSGIFIANVMSRSCWLERVYYLLQRRPKVALRRLQPGGLAVPVGDHRMQTYYYDPEEVLRAFSPAFVAEKVIGLGISVPPPYLAHWMQKFPGLFGLLQRVDRSVREQPLFRGKGDHFVVVLRASARVGGDP